MHHSTNHNNILGLFLNKILPSFLLFTVAIAEVSAERGAFFVPEKQQLKIEPHLLKRLEAAESKGKSQSQPIQVHVLLAQPATEEIHVALETLGATVQIERGEQLQIVLPLGSVPALAALPQVDYVRLPRQATPQATNFDGGNFNFPGASDVGTISEGVHTTAADQLHPQGITGRGVRIAVVDVGFQGYRDRLGTDLPAEVSTKSFRSFWQSPWASALFFEGDPHGTAAAEILHDMAPEAELVLVAIGTAMEYREALDWLRTQDIDIISLSLGWINDDPLDGRGEVSTETSRLIDETGVLVVAAAGNEREHYWTGRFNDPDGNGWHNFSQSCMLHSCFPLEPVDTTLDIELRAGDKVNVVLNWDDWGDDPTHPRSSEDYDLYLRCPGGEICRASEDLQTGWPGHAPLESLTYQATQPGTHSLQIFRRSPGNGEHRMRLYIRGLPVPMEYQTPFATLSAPADGLGVFAVGAVDVNTDKLEPYSSMGPTWDGRIKPDIVAPTGVTTTSYGPGGFPGTSAATPHVAGAAALLKSQAPDRNVHDLQELLREAGWTEDFLSYFKGYGSGVLDLSAFVHGAPQ